MIRPLTNALRTGLDRRLFAAIPFLVWVLLPISSKAQDNPIFRIDDDVVRFSFSSSGRIAYAARHVFSVKKIQLQRDDIWISEADGKKRRILQGEKFVRGTGPFSYTVRGIRWSPDSTKLSVELAASEMINDAGNTRESVMTLLLDDTGREIPIAGADSVIPGASNAAWLADGAAVVYLTEQTPPGTPSPSPSPNQLAAPPTNKLYAMNRVNPLTGRSDALFKGHLFSATVWDSKLNSGIAIEQDQGATGTPRLVLLDVLRETSRALGTLDGYAGGLTLAPSGKKIAYWINNEQLEIREIDAPNRAARVRVAVGTLAWSGDETRVLVKRGIAARSGGLVWVTLPPLATVAAGARPAVTEIVPESILHDLQFRLFDVSPDGKSLAVVEPGKRNILVYPVR